MEGRARTPTPHNRIDGAHHGVSPLQQKGPAPRRAVRSGSPERLAVSESLRRRYHAQLDPDVVGSIAISLAALTGIIVPTVLIIRYKLKKKELEMRGSDAELGPLVDVLRDDLDDTRAQLAEIHERLDFTERVLAAKRESHEDRSG